MSMLYSQNLKYPDGELGIKNGFQDQLPMDLNPYNNQQQQLQLQSNSGLARLKSAPSSFLADLVNGGAAAGSSDFDDFRYFQPPSPDIDTIFATFLSPSSSSPDPPPAAVRKEAADSEIGAFQFGDRSSVEVNNSMDFGSAATSSSPSFASVGNGGSNLARHNSSPAGLFSSLVVENGFNGVGEANSLSRSNTVTSSSSRLRRSTNFTPAARQLPQISEIEEEPFIITTGKRPYSSSNISWNNDSWTGGKKLKQDHDDDDFDLFNLQQDGSNGNRLAHHLSLPKTAAEMESIEKFLQLQGGGGGGAVPCKIRAKRGFATHPRSIAERVRRTKISERMRKLQDLFPKTDKQTSTSEMLDMAVDYIKDLQKQVKSMRDTKARCTCLREHKA
ncbi:Transcription factor bHLH130 [Linum perenne]